MIVALPGLSLTLFLISVKNKKNVITFHLMVSLQVVKA